MAQLHKVAKFLRANNTGAGVTASQVSKATKVPRANVLKRISDLRVLEGRQIYSNVRSVKGKRTVFYRFAANS